MQRILQKIDRSISKNLCIFSCIVQVCSNYSITVERISIKPVFPELNGGKDPRGIDERG